MRYVVVAIFSLAALGAAAPPDAAKPPETLAQSREDERQRVETQWSPLPAMPAKPFADILQFHIADGWLVADSPLYRGKSFNYRIGISDVGGMGNLRLTTSRFPGLYYIFFEHYDFTVPGLVYRHLEVLRAPIMLQVLEDDDLMDEGVSISLVETVDPGAEAPVTLRVQVMPDVDPGKAVNEAFTAASLYDLRRKYPDEYERFLRPMMRGFKEESVGFGVDSRTAWQVLSDTWKPSTDLPAKVEAIIVRLNADDYSARAAAQKDLEQLGEPAALYLMATPHTDLTPEQAARLAGFIAPYHPLDDAQIARFRKDENFLLDCLFNDDPAVREAALGRLRQMTGQNVPLDPDQSPQERIESIRRLRDQLVPIPATEPIGN